MKKVTFLVFAAILVSLGLPGIGQAQDERQLIEVPDDAKARFLAEMRRLNDSLDDLIAALAEGDFKEVADIAETQMGFGHHMLEALKARGASKDEIDAARARVRQMAKRRREMMAQGMMPKMGRGMGFGMGLGRHMSDDLRAIGWEMHAAAGQLAEVAKKVSGEPSANDFKAALGKLQGVTATCRACHAAFRVH